MEAENYITIQGWMRTKLKLKGNELLVYAIIYGFCQNGEQKFTGSLQYLADWCGATKQGVLNNLKSLIEKGYIHKSEYTKNGVKYCEYGIKDSLIVLNSVEYHIKQSLTNNIDNNIDKSISKDIESKFEFGKKQSKKLSMWDKCISLIHEHTANPVLQGVLVTCLQMFIENSKENGTPFFTNNFKGKLNKLKELSDDEDIQRRIIAQTIDNGWNNFYQLKTPKGGKDVFSQKGTVVSEAYTASEIAQMKQLEIERAQKGMRTKF